MKKKYFILSSIFLFLLTSCDNKNNKIEVKKPMIRLLKNVI